MRPEKAGVVSELQERIEDSQFVLFVDYTAMHVTHFEEVRKRLRETGAKMRVIKNTHLEKAAEKLSLGDVSEYLHGQCAIVYGGDIAATIKVLNNFTKEFDKPKLRAGLLEGQLLDGERTAKLSELPTREEALAKLLGLIMQPAQRLATVLNEPPTMLARQLNEVPTMLVRVIKAKADKEQG